MDVFVHEAARDDIGRDKNKERRDISLSKLGKFQTLEKVKGLTKQALAEEFGKIKKHNDEVDATLLHALRIGASDFLVTQDQGLHDRGQNHSADLARRVLHVADAAQLLEITYEPRDVPILHVYDVSAHTISISDTFFDSLREGYHEFNEWWQQKCVAQRRPCWVVYNNDVLAGLVVRKDETGADTDATQKLSKILKICTFKVSPEQRGIKLGELLLKKTLWHAQQNKYDLIYITAYAEQAALISLLEYFGFQKTATKADGELIFERVLSTKKLERIEGQDVFDTDRRNYPRVIVDNGVRGFVIPIKEGYHDVLYPDLRDTRQSDLFAEADGPRRPGNTIRRVYLCRAKSNLSSPGSVLFFYKGKSDDKPSQALTAVGVLEEMSLATSTKELMLLTGGRSVYSEKELRDYAATSDSPVKVINYLLIDYIDPPVMLKALQGHGIFAAHPPQSISELKGSKLRNALALCNFGFKFDATARNRSWHYRCWKTWMLQRAFQPEDVQVLSAGKLISDEIKRQARVDPVPQDQLRNQDILANQRALVDGLTRSVDPTGPTVVLDAHVAVDTSKGLILIPEEIFGQIGPDLIVFVYSDVDVICSQRSRDITRSRPPRSLAELSRQQIVAHDWASELASRLGLGFTKVETGDISGLIEAINGLQGRT